MIKDATAVLRTALEKLSPRGPRDFYIYFPGKTVPFQRRISQKSKQTHPLPTQKHVGVRGGFSQLKLYTFRRTGGVFSKY